MIENKYLRYSFFLGLSILMGIGILFVMAVVHHSDAPRVDNLPAACAIIAGEIHYPEKSSHTSNCDIRHWYDRQVKKIPMTLLLLQQDSAPVSDQANCAYTLRHQLRVEARVAMPSKLETALLRMRDLFTYGHFDGPTYAQLLGHPLDDAAYEGVINSAIKTDTQVDGVCAE